MEFDNLAEKLAKVLTFMKIIEEIERISNFLEDYQDSSLVKFY